MDSKAAIISTLAYFDLFHYPITEREIYYFLPRFIPPAEFQRSLNELQVADLIFSWEGMYTVRNDQSIISRRRQGNALAANMLVTAEKVANILCRFPFVRGVGVSGSLSKQFADKGSDIDFFIITAPNRLWIARTSLHLLKKLSFMIHKEDWFCMNYFIDEEALEIPEKNMYTAIEVVTVLPMKGTKVFSEFAAANRWTERWLPNSHGRLVFSSDERPSLFKRALESVWNHPLGDRVDRWLMDLTARRWHKKTMEGAVNNRGIVLSLDATRHWARPEPGRFQEGLLESYEQRKMLLLRRYEATQWQAKEG